MEKKSERLEVRLGYEEKQTFTEACENQGDTPSSAVRRFINGYVRRSDEDVLSSAWRGAVKRRAWKPIAFAAVFAAIAALFWGLSNRASVETDGAIFSARDINGDGQLEYSEHGIPPGLNDTPNGVMRVLDLDADGKISREEFVQKGRMVYALEHELKDAEADETKGGMALVEFEIGKERSKTGTFVGATINANGIDRLVIWSNAGTPTVMEGEVAIATGLDGIIELQADVITKPK
ncbi:MAG: hypothetical protein ABJN69_06865 [Hellea sp.]